MSPSDVELGQAPGPVEWASFLDQELARRDTRQYFVWSATLATLAGAWLLASPALANLTLRQGLGMLGLGAVLYWLVTRPLASLFQNATSPPFLVRHFTALHALAVIRYLGEIGLPRSLRLRHVLDGVASAAGALSTSLLFEVFPRHRWLVVVAALLTAGWAGFHVLFAFLGGKSLARLQATALLTILRLPGVRAKLDFSEDAMAELRGGRENWLPELPAEAGPAVRITYKASSWVWWLLVAVAVGSVAVVVVESFPRILAATEFHDAHQFLAAGAAFALGVAGAQLLLALSLDRSRAKLEALRVEAFTRFPGHLAMDQAFRLAALLRDANIHDDFHPLNAVDALLVRPAKVLPGK